MRALQQQYGLKILRISLDRSEAGRTVLLSLLAPDGDEVALLTVGSGELGLLTEGSLASEPPPDESGFRIPEHLLLTMASIVRDLDPPETPVWLHFDSACGMLPMLPWERFLQPRFGVPVLRMAHLTLRPVPPRDSLDAVICFSYPMAEGAADPQEVGNRFLYQIPPDLARHVRFHIFADSQAQPMVDEVQARFAGRFDIRVYDPPVFFERAQSRADGKVTQLDAVENPWLRWMEEAMRGQSADIVHFLSHGYVRRDRGGLALAAPPSRDLNADFARFVFANELSEFLNRVGAWSVAVTSTPGNRSPGGLRLLADQLSRLRPGPCMVHDLEHADSAEGLGGAYYFLYDVGGRPAPNSAALTLYCPPHHGSVYQGSEDSSRAILEEYTLAGRLGESLQGTAEPNWVKSSQRLLEQSASQLTTQPESESQAAIQTGTANALRFVADVLAQHAKAPAKDPEAQQ